MKENKKDVLITLNNYNKKISENNKKKIWDGIILKNQ